VDAEAGRQRRGHLGELLGEHRVVPVVTGRRAAVLLRDLQAEVALLAGLDPQVARQCPVLEELLGARPDLTVEELADRAAEGLVVGIVDAAFQSNLTRSD
jgi:hypothetical protein